MATETATRTGWWEGGLVFLGAVVFGAYTYWLTTLKPNIPPGGLLGGYDQTQYLNIARLLSSGHLPDAHQYTYGLGFPLVAAPFYALGYHADPFIAPSLILLGGSMTATYIVANRLAGRPAALIVVLLMLFATPLVSLVISPWSSTVSLFCLTVGLALVTSERGLTWWSSLALGVLAAWSFSSRFVDVVPVIVLGVYAIIADRSGRRVSHLLWMCVPAIAGAAVVLWTQHVAFGSILITPYESHLRPDGTSDQSLAHYSIGDIPVHFYETFLSATQNGARVNALPLLLISPFLVFGPVGAVVILRSGDRRGLHFAMIAVTLVLALVYLSFVAGGGGDLRFHNARYWIPYYPYWTLLAVIGMSWILGLARRLDRRRISFEGE